jgi:hypothetical protein
MKRTKSKNIETYKYFLHYEDPLEIPLDQLANQLGVHKNKLIALIGSAKRYPHIYLELRRLGYAEDQIPHWLRRPNEKNAETARDRLEPVKPRLENAKVAYPNAKNAENAETYAQNAETLRTTTKPIEFAPPYTSAPQQISTPATQRLPSLSVAEQPPQRGQFVDYPSERPITIESLDGRILYTNQPEKMWSSPFQSEMAAINLEMGQRIDDLRQRMYEDTSRRMLRYRDRIREKRMREEVLRDLEERARTEPDPFTRLQYIQLLNLLKSSGY